ncbi:ABC transporter ATP-binding protein [Yinghuangia sp. ASG 101]|uniref:dipeptide ABC transporter ATP-binding protein n=1 Tax=Yinghuangia sp. ASG 101 TaxID=2896848 RepID=UPI001E3E89DE|nr:ABC transporter ATP-binding protein [Yinghuangia sp. ASG 101]UGQ12546.1 ABC transporter ATP-binding protein [Yinghuangia sp. ASG 101]
MTLLDLRGLEVAYQARHSAAHRVVHGIDLTVAAGEVVAVVGESGSGKSTTAHAVLGLLPRGGTVTAGQVLFDGRDLLTLTDKELRAVRGAEIGFVPQDPGVSLNPVRRVGDQVAEALRVHGLADPATARARAVELLGEAGLPAPGVRARQYPHELSGGMRQRVLIAIALACRPRLIIADEPTSALDVTVQKGILDHLDTLTREHGIAVLLITHDLGVAADRAQRVVVMSQGRVVESGPGATVLTRPEHPYTRALIAAAPGLDAPAADAPRSGTSGPGAPGPPPDAGAAPVADRLLTVSGLGKAFPLPDGTSVRAVEDVGFHIDRGETYALVGESGSGKSTTARLVLGLERADTGRVDVAGTTVTGLDRTRAGRAELRRLRRRMQIVHQNPYASLDPRMTVADIVAEPLRAFRIGDRASRRARAAHLVDHVALPADVLGRRPAELSGGMRQRVAIARALAPAPDLLVCDEPTSALDVSVQAQILDLLARLQRELRLAVLFISHDLAVVRRVAHRVGVMRDGRLVESGPADAVLREPEHAYTRELLRAVPGRRRADAEAAA